MEKRMGGRDRMRDGNKEVPGKGLRMRDLTEATGLPKSAILHYLAQGLLPEPVRTGPNMAYYDPVCVERIKFIKAMQNSYSFPLSKIKHLLEQKDQGRNIHPLIELSEAIFGDEEGPLLNEKEFCQATGLSHDEVQTLTETGILLPLEPGIFNHRDINAGRMYARGIALGATPADLAFYARAAQEIVDGEMRLRQKLTGHLPEDEDAERTKGLAEAAKGVRNYVIDRVFQLRVVKARSLKDGGLVS